MCPINYGILQQIQQTANPVMGSAPSAGAIQPSGLDQLSQGVLSGMLQGQQIRQGDLNMKKGEQDLKQGEQSMQMNAQQMQMNDLKLQDAQHEKSLKERQEEAAKQGIDAYRKETYLQDPVKGLDFDTKFANMKEAQSKAEKADLDNFKAEETARGDFYQKVALGGSDPKTGELIPEKAAQAWQLARENLPKAVKDSIAPNYDQNSYAAGMLTNQIAEAKWAKEHPKQAQSVPGKIQADANSLRDEINKRKARGEDTSLQEQQLKTLDAAEQKSATPTQMVQTPGQQVTGNVTTGELNRGAEAADISRNVINKLSALETLDKSDNIASGSLANIRIGTAQGVAGLGSIFGVPIDPKVSESEAFNAIAKDLQLDYQAKLKGATSDRDMNIVATAAPQLNNTKQGRQLMYNWGKAMNTEIIQRQEFRRDWSEKHNGSLSGAEEAWGSFINSESRVDPKTRKFDVEKYSRKHWKDYLDDNFVAKKADEPASKPSTKAGSGFQEGQVYQDANGNKATFSNGKWTEVK